MSESIRNYCYFIYNEGMVRFSAKDYVVFASKAIVYSIKGLIKNLLK